MKHYKSAIKPEALHAAETLTKNRLGQAEQLRTKEGKILRNIIGTKFQADKIICVKSKTLPQKMKNHHALCEKGD